MFYSPLRYPGGKNRLSKFISQICVDNKINGHYVEPYAGGASVALHLLIENKVKHITINDYDRSIYAFWRCVLSYSNQLCRLIEETEVTIENWKIQKKIQENKAKESILDLGFSTFFLNRTNISGIISAGAIGGIKQEGIYKIDCRFNKELLIDRIKKIASHKNKIKLYNLDALQLIKKTTAIPNNTNTIFYFDPPYYIKGSSLYMNSYQDKQHKELSNVIKKIKNIHWIISYDDTKEISDIYRWINICQTKKYNLNHFAYRKKTGREILFFSKNLELNNLPKIVCT